jgi:glycosyltransferase involved in cell wall biosynthesis
MPPLVSVIIPCHNRSDLLVECLESINAQTYPNIEVFVVDDASEEDLEVAMQRIAWTDDKRATLLRAAANLGPGHARELGRQAAKGAFICYQDSDDWWLPGKVAAQVALLASNPAAGMCYCIARQFSALPVTGTETVRLNSDVAHTDFLPLLLESRRRPWGTGACMWARWATDRIGPWFPGWTWEDMEYDCRAGCHDISIVHLAESLCFYRTHTGMNQLRQTAVAKRARQTAASLLAISEHLAYFGKLVDPRIDAAHQWLLYDYSVLLLRVGAGDDAARLVQRLQATAAGESMARRAAAAVMGIQRVTRSSALAGLAGRGVGIVRQRVDRRRSAA